MSAADFVGYAALRRAAAPVTIGVAIDVPLIEVYPAGLYVCLSAGYSLKRVVRHVLNISEPGAKTSTHLPLGL